LAENLPLVSVGLFWGAFLKETKKKATEEEEVEEAQKIQ